MRALIWLGGDFRYEAWGQTPELTGPFDLVICADGGGRHALRLKLPVDVLLGDFDSISPQEKQALAPRRLLPYAPDKDYTDGQLAVAEALRQGTKQLTLAGAFGDRLDHTLANIALLQQIAEAGATGTATDGRQIARLMARRLTLEGAHVERVLEVMPYLTGLTRNYVQCLLDYDIPLQLQHTVKRIMGRTRVEGIEAVQVDEHWTPIPGTEEIIPCDTLLLSVGLIPENELSRKAGVMIDPVTGGPFVDNTFQTNVEGIFSAGNVVHVYDLVDWVTEAGFIAGKAAARQAQGLVPGKDGLVDVRAGNQVRYVVPHQINVNDLKGE